MASLLLAASHKVLHELSVSDGVRTRRGGWHQTKIQQLHTLPHQSPQNHLLTALIQPLVQLKPALGVEKEAPEVEIRGTTSFAFSALSLLILQQVSFHGLSRGKHNLERPLQSKVIVSIQPLCRLRVACVSQQGSSPLPLPLLVPAVPRFLDHPPSLLPTPLLRSGRGRPALNVPTEPEPSTTYHDRSLPSCQYLQRFPPRLCVEVTCRVLSTRRENINEMVWHPVKGCKFVSLHLRKLPASNIEALVDLHRVSTYDFCTFGLVHQPLREGQRHRRLPHTSGSRHHNDLPSLHSITHALCNCPVPSCGVT
mmetsp:Transcript_320/g.853  ORF Transcript_320/g.853 Transcript_320/m.853 type:complete len:310 (+) Transcript_320:4561-5490(+)